MAIVLSSTENIDLLLFLVKLAIAIGAIVILLVLIFWFRLKKIEKRMYLNKKTFKSRLNQLKPKQQSSQKSMMATQLGARRQTGNLVASHRRSPVNQVFCEPPKTQARNLTKTLIKPTKRNGHRHLSWLLAIAIASITGIAIAVMQLGNGFISPEITTFIWLVIGVMLVVSATFIKVA
jgi:DNA integrity scanning protein DisA with diadenylate cyclase activity